MKYIIYIILLLFSGMVISCKKFLEVDHPIDRLSSDIVFTDTETATATVLGIYTGMMSTTPLITSGGITLYTGLAADELYNADISDAALSEFYGNALSPDNVSLRNDFWLRGFSLIYHANACINGLRDNLTLEPEVREQLLGESLFNRAFIYYYLVSLFGDVPLLLKTDYEENSIAARTPSMLVYDQIISDLKEARDLLKNAYPTDQKVRPNKWTATALLARVYLVLEEWLPAEEEATLVIDSGEYALEPELDNVFLSSSNEAIWQIMQVEEGFNTTEGMIFVPYSWSTAVPDFPLTDHLLHAFETADLRKAYWVGSVWINGEIYHYPYKYKINEYGLPATEYQTNFRLAELYLIRAECYARQDKTPQAKADLDIIRERAGLPGITAGTPDELLSAIFQERRIELFSEWGHRWFDLKRTGKATEILGTVKPGWQPSDVLFPIPGGQIRANPNLTQNQGY